MLELTIINIVLLAVLAWDRYQGRKERSKLINVIIAKNSKEAINLELADNTKIKVKQKKKENEDRFIEMDDLTDEQHAQVLKDQMEGL